MKTTIVAEIGVNHNHNLDTAHRLIDEAKKAGADYVKFQLWEYDTFPKLDTYRLTHKSVEFVKKYAKKKGIGWFCTPFDIPSIEFLDSIDMDIWKIPSNAAVVKRIDVMDAIKRVTNRKWLLVSTGISTRAEQIMIRGMFKGLFKKIVMLYCISKYPAQPKDFNLHEMQKLPRLQTVIGGDFYYAGEYGLSDHSTTISIPVAAVALGATVIEKHLTLNRNQEGPDHKASLEPQEFAEMVKYIREVERAL